MSFVSSNNISLYARSAAGAFCAAGYYYYYYDSSSGCRR